MPKYDYHCPTCDITVEVEHGMREKPQVACPQCGGETKRVFTPSGMVLKGSGFYNTDYASDRPCCDSCPSAKACPDA